MLKSVKSKTFVEMSLDLNGLQDDLEWKDILAASSRPLNSIANNIKMNAVSVNNSNACKS